MQALFHASINKDLAVIKPQRTLSKDVYIGDYVFATSDKKLAAMYLVTKGLATIMDCASTRPSIMIVADSEDYAKKDIGGAIYTVPPETFKKTPQTELEGYELVSREDVTPISKEIYGSSIEAMKKLDISINFISQEIFDNLSKKFR